MLSRKTLPVELINLLRSSQVIKAGRQVNGDLQRLAVAAGYPPNHFCGALDLAAFAKNRFLITKATVSLAELFALIFHQCLPKNDTERVSSNWSDQELTNAQLEYAARDAYASLLLYHEINKTPLPLPFSTTATTLCGTPVLLLTDDNKKLAARGVVSTAASEEKFNGENLTKTRTVITIQEILIPGAIIGQNKEKSTGYKLPLKDFGKVPFDILAHRSHVRLEMKPSISTSNMHLDDSPMPEPDNHPPVDFQPPLDEHGIEMISVAEELNIVDVGDGVPDANTEPSREQDSESAAEGEKILGPATLPAYAFLIRSRVLKDIFHVFHMIYISRTHGLRQAFCQALRDAMLIPHPTDKALIEAYLKTHNVTWENMRRFHPKWLWRHCRRTIPPAEELYPVVHQVFMTYGPLKDAKTGLSLFNTAAWKIAKNILELIKNGYVSDPPGVQLYCCLGFDKKAGGLPIFLCERGTERVEGGVHTHLLSKLPSRGASVRHMVACLLDFILCHNLRVCSLVFFSLSFLTCFRLVISTQLARNIWVMTPFGCQMKFKSSRSHLASTMVVFQLSLHGSMEISTKRLNRLLELFKFRNRFASLLRSSHSTRRLIQIRSKLILQRCRALASLCYRFTPLLKSNYSLSLCGLHRPFKGAAHPYLWQPPKFGIARLKTPLIFTIR